MTVVQRMAPYTLLITRVLVGGIFLVAAVDKVQAPGAFAAAVRGYHVLPPDLALPFAYVLPWMEILIAAYLLIGFMSRLAGVSSIVLLSVFVIALTTKLVSGDTAHPCGCFGTGSHANPVLSFLSGGDTITSWDVIRDVLLIALSVLVVMRGPGPMSVDSVLSRHRMDSYGGAS